MIYVAWVGIFLIALLFFSGVLDRMNNPNRHLGSEGQRGLTEIELVRGRHGHYVVPGSINGTRTDFLIDTGATAVAVSEELASAAGLRKRREITSYTANGKVRGWATRIGTLSVGGLVLHDIRASILPSMSSNEALLGMSVLKHLEIVQRGDTMTLRVPAT